MMDPPILDPMVMDPMVMDPTVLDPMVMDPTLLHPRTLLLDLCQGPRTLLPFHRLSQTRATLDQLGLGKRRTCILAPPGI
jgi:hypothetical protein